MNFFKNLFGVKSAVTSTTDRSMDIIPSPSPVTITTGETSVVTIEETGTGSRPITLIYTTDIGDATESSIGIEVTDNVKTYSWKGSPGGISSTYSIAHRGYTQNYAATFDIYSLRLGIEISTTTVAWDKDMLVETTTYTNVSGNLWIIAAAYQLATTGSISQGQMNKVPVPAK